MIIRILKSGEKKRGENENIFYFLVSCANTWKWEMETEFCLILIEPGANNGRMFGKGKQGENEQGKA